MTTSGLFPTLPPESRIWIYVADRPLTSDDRTRLEAALEPFLAGWSSHRRPVTGAVRVLDDRFVVLAAHVPDGDISGCGIDKSVHRVEEVGRELGLAWKSSLDVAWRDGDGTVRVGTRSDFRAEVTRGSIGSGTSVFDPSVTTLAELREGAFERPVRLSWHARAFRISDTAREDA